jgi:hypothetical protein
MDSKGLREMRSRLPFLEEFLSVPPNGPHLSVWHLKQFLEVNDPVAYRPILAVSVDYGFVNCQTFEETCILIEIYQQVLLKSGNPLALHQACVAGELFEIASCFVQMEERWRPLMRNCYPLAEVVEREPAPELTQELGSESEAKQDSADLPSLMSRFWSFIGGGFAK